MLKKLLLGTLVVLVVGIAALLFVAIQQARQTTRSVLCKSNLKQIVLGLHNYHDTYGKFPPARLDDHSWRVRIEPLMMSSPYYINYRFNERWNSEWNRTLEFRSGPPTEEPAEPPGTKIVDLSPFTVDLNAPSMASSHWQCPDHIDEHSTHTSYLMIVGPGAFGQANDGRNLSEITDNHATTIAVAETRREDISWLKPQDFDVETMSFQINDPDRPSISSDHPGGPWVVMVDGSTVQLSPDLPPEVVKAMITINGGEIIIRDEKAPGGFRLEN